MNLLLYKDGQKRYDKPLSRIPKMLRGIMLRNSRKCTHTHSNTVAVNDDGNRKAEWPRSTDIIAQII